MTSKSSSDVFFVDQAMRHVPLGLLLDRFEKHVIDKETGSKCLASIQLLHSRCFTYSVDREWLRNLVRIQAYDLLCYLIAHVSISRSSMLVNTIQYMLLIGTPGHEVHQLICKFLQAICDGLRSNCGYGCKDPIPALVYLRDQVFSASRQAPTATLLHDALAILHDMEPLVTKKQWDDPRMLQLAKSMREACLREFQEGDENSKPARYDASLAESFHKIQKTSCEADAVHWLCDNMPAILAARFVS